MYRGRSYMVNLCTFCSESKTYKKIKSNFKKKGHIHRKYPNIFNMTILSYSGNIY